MVWPAIQQARDHRVQAAFTAELGQAEAGLGTWKIWLSYTRFVWHKRTCPKFQHSTNSSIMLHKVPPPPPTTPVTQALSQIMSWLIPSRLHTTPQSMPLGEQGVRCSHLNLCRAQLYIWRRLTTSQGHESNKLSYQDNIYKKLFSHNSQFSCDVVIFQN